MEMVRILKIKVNLVTPNPRKKSRKKGSYSLYPGLLDSFFLFNRISYEFLNLTILKGFCDKNQKRSIAK